MVGVCDPHCRLELADILSVEGRLDEAGFPLGRCLVQLRSGEELGGLWRGGLREGLGGLAGPGLEARGLRSIRGYYRAGRLEGPGQVRLLDGSEFQVNFVGGRAEGGVVSWFSRTESELDGETCSGEHVTTGPTIGTFSRGILSGPVWVSQLGGGWLHGVPDQRGEMTGDQIMYIYPDLTTVLWGSFNRGLMVRAVHTRLADVDLRGLVPRAMVSQRDLGGPQFSFSPSSARVMEVSPLLQDPYETLWVTVRQSTVAGKT